jgi:hypothetical protein
MESQYARAPPEIGGRVGGRFLIAQDRTQPALRFGDRHVFAPGVVLDLVAAHLPDHEVARPGVGEIEAGDRGGRGHGAGLGEVHPNRPSSEQVEELVLLGVVRARRVPKGGADAAVPLADQILA